MHIYNIKQMGQLTEANSCEKSANKRTAVRSVVLNELNFERILEEGMCGI